MVMSRKDLGAALPGIAGQRDLGGFGQCDVPRRAARAVARAGGRIRRLAQLKGESRAAGSGRGVTFVEKAFRRPDSERGAACGRKAGAAGGNGCTQHGPPRRPNCSRPPSCRESRRHVRRGGYRPGRYPRPAATRVALKTRRHESQLMESLKPENPTVVVPPPCRRARRGYGSSGAPAVGPVHLRGDVRRPSRRHPWFVVRQEGPFEKAAVIQAAAPG